MAASRHLAAVLGGWAADVARRLLASVVEVISEAGQGAGTVWRPDGTIVTSHHVAPGRQALVRLADGRTLPGVVLARDLRNDLAVLKVSAAPPAAPIRDGRQLRAGELVLAIGHPFGQRGAVTLGVVSSALPAVPAPGARELIRADLLLGPGNSGGPLADARGRVVGINAMIGGGLALAVPSHLVERLLAALDQRAA